MRRLCLPAALLLLPFLSTPASAAPPPDSFFQGLSRAPPITEPFHDVRFRRALKAPLVSSGTLSWHGGLDFERTVTSPWRETGRVHGRTLTVARERMPERVIPLARAPELQVLFNGLAALFAGDKAGIDAMFTSELSGGDHWRLELVPRDETLRASVAALELLGEGTQARCLIVRQPGAETLTLLGAASPPVMAPDFAAVVQGNCPSP